MSQNPFELVVQTLLDTVNQMFGWFGLTPLGVAETLGVLFVFVVAYQLYKARKDGGRFTFDE